MNVNIYIIQYITYVLYSIYNIRLWKYQIYHIQNFRRTEGLKWSHPTICALERHHPKTHPKPRSQTKLMEASSCECLVIANHSCRGEGENYLGCRTSKFGTEGVILPDLVWCSMILEHWFLQRCGYSREIFIETPWCGSYPRKAARISELETMLENDSELHGKTKWPLMKSSTASTIPYLFQAPSMFLAWISCTYHTKG